MKKAYSLLAMLLSIAYANAQYCSSPPTNANDTTFEYITRVQLNTGDNDTSGVPGSGYSDFTATTFTSVNKTLSYTVSISKYSFYNDPEGVAVWIDYNGDGDFGEANELVYSDPANTNSPVSGSITIPLTAATGLTRMRVMLFYNLSTSPGFGDECDDGLFGEVEDYTIDILPFESPGDVITNLQLWMKADVGTTLTGTDVDAWEDQSPNKFPATSQGVTDAQLVTDGLNFNPTLRFAGAEFLNLGNQPQLNLQPNSNQMTIITVVVNGATSQGTILSKADASDANYQVWFSGTDRVLHHTLGKSAAAFPNTAVRYGTVYALNEPKITSGVVANTGSSLTRLSPYMNGVVDTAVLNEGTNIGTIAADVLIGATRLTGNTGSSSLYNGDIAEIIMYDRDLTSTELQKVESYLAIKYGITLGANEANWATGTGTSPSGYAGTSNNYLNSAGSIIWNGTTNAGYGYNVFGLARDDDSGFIQTKSTSSNIGPSDILTMEVESGTFSSDKSYLMVGNNGLAETVQTSSLSIRTVRMLNKIWIARESVTDVGTVELEFDMSGSGVSNLDDLDLYIATNSSFTDYENYEGTNVGGVLTFTGVNLSNGQYFTLAEPQVITGQNALFFDGIDDYVEDKTPATQGLTDYTIMGWIKNPGQSSTIPFRRIMGVNGQFRFYLSSGLLAIEEGQTIGIASTGTDTVRDWVHFTIIVNTSVNFARFYLNGKFIGGGSVDPLPSNPNPFRIGTDTGINFFRGSIDEIRIFNIALTLDQVQSMVHQEIEQNGVNVRGKIVPKDIEDFTTGVKVPWSSLIAHYDMSDIKGNRLEDQTGNGNVSFMKNMSTIEAQTAPMPYISVADGNWTSDATWENGTVWDTPSASSINWSIVQIKNNVTASASYSTLGLMVDPGAKLTVTGTNPTVTSTSPFAITAGTGFALTNIWYAEINGIVDLQGESQFVQTQRSDLGVTSAGYIEKDQQGTANRFTYNYWSSPVSMINTTANNQTYTLGDVLLNGTTVATPGAVTWTPNADGGTSPFTISTRWIYKFVNGGDEDYDAWQFVRNNGNIVPGEGYTMKGVSLLNEKREQNYIFRGKPNNGVITVSPLGDNNLYLVGNPYPSALDANVFINNNITNNATSGTLYFWEHWGGGTHDLLDYQGGYATYTLSGGTPAMSHPTVNQTGSGTETPKRYIAVGQGFFVQGDTNAGNGLTATVEFNNTQRRFIPEYIGASEFSTFMRNGSNSDDIGLIENNTNAENNSTESTTDDDPTLTEEELDELYASLGIPRDFREKIRLGYTNPAGFHRQLLLTFDTNSTDGIDLGYEGESIGVTANDMYWTLNNEEFVIQAVQNLTTTREVPIGLVAETAGGGTISIDKLENIDDSVGVYIKDNYTGVTHDLRANSFQVNLPAGETNDKYSLVFQPEGTLGINDDILENGIIIYTDTETEEIVITNNTNFKLEGIDMHTILGQRILSIKEGMNENTIRIPINDKASGIYVISIYSEKGKISKKLIIQ
ncbi:hypothetical protein IMCC3317_31220 [Kordia antarctica]|uniref:LamG-like jellyroll fold domain-containing protein n=1 Tax=Kordia antarctica TaxID=1218801 RepID=A0A7L4ZMJ1_9FLAO|nr:GEVED domain-containing protein [Kordia antarctica]QHI37741.1 hypothetical protein IMCC3317_31220 [Kordia antarctica]